jgi:hypothetical protein
MKISSFPDLALARVTAFSNVSLRRPDFVLEGKWGDLRTEVEQKAISHTGMMLTLEYEGQRRTFNQSHIRAELPYSRKSTKLSE